MKRLRLASHWTLGLCCDHFVGETIEIIEPHLGALAHGLQVSQTEFGRAVVLQDGFMEREGCLNGNLSDRRA